MIQFTLNIGTLDYGNPSSDITNAKAKNYDDLVFQIEQAFESTDVCITVVTLSIDKSALTEFELYNLYDVGVDFINGFDQMEISSYLDNPIIEDIRPICNCNDDLPF